jgi:hypothetical protein
MVIMQTPDGTTGEYHLRPTESGLRLEGRCASYDLRTMVMKEGWRIQAVKTARGRKRLKWARLAATASGSRVVRPEATATAA